LVAADEVKELVEERLSGTLVEAPVLRLSRDRPDPLPDVAEDGAVLDLPEPRREVVVPERDALREQGGVEKPGEKKNEGNAFRAHPLMLRRSFLAVHELVAAVADGDASRHVELRADPAMHDHASELVVVTRPDVVEVVFHAH